MDARKTTLAALAAVLALGTSAFAFAQQPPGSPEGRDMPARMRGAIYLRMLQEIDANNDGKITKQEVEAGAEKLFAAIDANSDGNVTPGEIRKYHEARRDEWRTAREAERAERRADRDKDHDGDRADASPPPPPPGAEPPPPPPGMRGHGMGGPDMGGPDMGGPDGDGPRMGGPGRHGHHGEGHDRADRGPDGDRGGWRDGRDRDDDRPRHPPMGPGMMMRMIDTDESGQISKQEALAFADGMFERMDTNKDGVIDANDLPKGPLWPR